MSDTSDLQEKSTLQKTTTKQVPQWPQDLYPKDAYDLTQPYHTNVLDLIDHLEDINHRRALDRQELFDYRNFSEKVTCSIAIQAIEGLKTFGRILHLRKMPDLFTAIGSDYLLISPSLHRDRDTFLQQHKVRRRSMNVSVPNIEYMALLGNADYNNCFRRGIISISELFEEIGIGNFTLRLNPDKTKIYHQCDYCRSPSHLYIKRDIDCKCDRNTNCHVFAECSDENCTEFRGIHYGQY